MTVRRRDDARRGSTTRGIRIRSIRSIVRARSCDARDALRRDAGISERFGYPGAYDAKVQRDALRVRIAERDMRYAKFTLRQLVSSCVARRNLAE